MLNLHNKLILITGASRGLGAALATELGRAGAQTILLARTVGGLTETDDAIRRAGGPSAVLVPCDLSKDHDQLDALGAELYQRYGKLDGLILNAAHLVELSPVANTAVKEWEHSMAVNATANYRLLRSLTPLLKQSSSAIVLGMLCNSLPQHDAYWSGYRASKKAFEEILKSYAAEEQGEHLRVMTHDPGPMATKLHAAAYPGRDPKKNPLPSIAAEKITGEVFH